MLGPGIWKILPEEHVSFLTYSGEFFAFAYYLPGALLEEAECQIAIMDLKSLDVKHWGIKTRSATVYLPFSPEISLESAKIFTKLKLKEAEWETEPVIAYSIPWIVLRSPKGVCYFYRLVALLLNFFSVWLEHQ